VIRPVAFTAATSATTAAAAEAAFAAAALTTSYFTLAAPVMFLATAGRGGCACACGGASGVAAAAARGGCVARRVRRREEGLGEGAGLVGAPEGAERSGHVLQRAQELRVVLGRSKNVCGSKNMSWLKVLFRVMHGVYARPRAKCKNEACACFLTPMLPLQSAAKKAPAFVPVAAL